MIKAITVYTLMIVGSNSMTVPNIVLEKDCQEMVETLKTKLVFSRCLKTVIVVPVYLNEEGKAK